MTSWKPRNFVQKILCFHPVELSAKMLIRNGLGSSFHQEHHIWYGIPFKDILPFKINAKICRWNPFFQILLRSWIADSRKPLKRAILTTAPTRTLCRTTVPFATALLSQVYFSFSKFIVTREYGAKFKRVVAASHFFSHWWIIFNLLPFN